MQENIKKLKKSMSKNWKNSSNNGLGDYLTKGVSVRVKVMGS